MAMVEVAAAATMEAAVVQLSGLTAAQAVAVALLGSFPRHLTRFISMEMGRVKAIRSRVMALDVAAIAARMYRVLRAVVRVTRVMSRCLGGYSPQ